MRHDLTGGEWAEIRPVTDLKGADRTAINHHIRVTLTVLADDDEGNVSAETSARHNVTLGDLRTKGMIARAVTAWSFTEPVPVIEATGEMSHAGSLDQVPLSPLMEIEDLIAPHLRMLMRTPDPKDGLSETTSRSNGRSSARAPSLKG